MSDNTKRSAGQTFLKGALVLGIANFIVKLIGAGFKIPLIKLIGDTGSGYFNVAYQIYTFMFIIATAGFPVAISKMVSESLAHGAEAEARKIFRVALRALSAIGLVGTFVMLAFADSLAAIVGMPDASLGITLIAPGVLFVAITSAYRGYFQGRQNMYPTAFSEVIESSGKMILGLIGAYIFMSMTVNGSLTSAVDFAAREISSPHLQTVFASSGAIFGVTAGTFLAATLLIVTYLIHRRKHKLDRNEQTTKGSLILKNLIIIAVPITIGASVSSLTTLIDMGTISRRLVIRPEVFEEYAYMFAEGSDFFKKAVAEGWQGAELLAQKAATLYGMYTGKALTMFNLPLTLIVALGTSVVPAISAAVAKGKTTEAKSLTESTLRIATLFAAPCAFGMAVFSREILNLLFSDYNAHIVLSILSIAIIPVGLVQVSNSVLQAYGKVYKPVIHMIIGGIIKVLFNYFAIPYLGIDGAPVGTGLCYLVIAFLNIRSIIKVAKIDFKWGSFILKPVAAAAIMGSVGFVLSTFLPMSRALCIVEIGVCVLIYGASVFAVKAISREDILTLPKGARIAAILEKYKLIK